ncbi:MAG: hypothetical protein E7387_08810 [Ruminococcaceae bacterium]|nr:hypothetical protein [Oscillospiraceae bacterium]
MSYSKYFEDNIKIAEERLADRRDYSYNKPIRNSLPSDDNGIKIVVPDLNTAINGYLSYDIE